MILFNTDLKPLDIPKPRASSKCKICLLWALPALFCPLLLAAASSLYLMIQLEPSSFFITLITGASHLLFAGGLALHRLCAFKRRYGVYPSCINSGLYELGSLDTLRARPRICVIFGLLCFGVLLFCQIYGSFMPFFPESMDSVSLPIIQSAIMGSLLGLHLLLSFFFKIQTYGICYFIGVLFSIAGILLIKSRKNSFTLAFNSSFFLLMEWFAIGILCFAAMAIALYFIKKWKKSYFIHETVSFALILAIDGAIRICYGLIGSLISGEACSTTTSNTMLIIAIGIMESLALFLMFKASIESMIGPALALASLTPFLTEIIHMISNKEMPKLVVIFGMVTSLAGAMLILIFTQSAVLKQRAKQPKYMEEYIALKTFETSKTLV